MTKQTTQVTIRRNPRILTHKRNQHRSDAPLAYLQADQMYQNINLSFLCRHYKAKSTQFASSRKNWIELAIVVGATLFGPQLYIKCSWHGPLIHWEPISKRLTPSIIVHIKSTNPSSSTNHVITLLILLCSKLNNNCFGGKKA